MYCCLTLNNIKQTYVVKSQKFSGSDKNILITNAVTATNRNADITLFEFVNIGLGTGINKKFTKQPWNRLRMGNYGSFGLYFRLNEAF